MMVMVMMVMKLMATIMGMKMLVKMTEMNR